MKKNTKHHLIKQSVLVFIIAIPITWLARCHSAKGEQALVGTYKSKEYTYLERVLHSLEKKSYSVGTTLLIRKDSSYTEITCGTIIEGTWRVDKNDSLVLYCLHNRFRNDSLNKTRIASCGTLPEKYKIEANGELTWAYPDAELKRTMCECLKKEE